MEDLRFVALCKKETDTNTLIREDATTTNAHESRRERGAARVMRAIDAQRATDAWRGRCTSDRCVSLQAHRALETACEQLIAASLQEEPHAFAARWEAIEQALREHMAAEEDVLFPAYQEVHPEEIDALRADHVRIRALLSDITAHVRSHGIHAGRLRRLVSEVHAHAVQEDKTIYRWAAQQGFVLGEPPLHP